MIILSIIISSILDKINIKCWNNSLEKSFNKKDKKWNSAIKMAKKIIEGSSSVDLELEKIEKDFEDKNLIKSKKIIKKNTENQISNIQKEIENEKIFSFKEYCFKIYEKIKENQIEEALKILNKLEKNINLNDKNIYYSLIFSNKEASLIYILKEWLNSNNKKSIELFKKLKNIYNKLINFMESQIFYQNEEILKEFWNENYKIYENNELDKKNNLKESNNEKNEKEELENIRFRVKKKISYLINKIFKITKLISENYSIIIESSIFDNNNNDLMEYKKLIIKFIKKIRNKQIDIGLIFKGDSFNFRNFLVILND